jgi:dolichol-phosphate mannosyltransferase
MSGFFMVRRSSLEGVPLNPVGYKILIEVVARARLRWIGEVGYVFRERTDGKSKVTASIYAQYLEHLLRLRLATLPASRFFKFCVVGASGVIVDMTILYLLSDPNALGLGLTRSKVVAAETAIVSNFLLNDAWTFGDRTRHAPGFRPKLRRLLGFNAICAAGLLLNVLILNALFNFAGMNRYLANGISILAVTGWNYWLNRKLNFTPMSPAEVSGPPSVGQRKSGRPSSAP